MALCFVFVCLIFFTNGFVMDSNQQLSVALNNTDDIKYLHFLLADEKNERLNLQKEIDQLKSTYATNLQHQQSEIDLLKSSLQSAQEQLERYAGSNFHTPAVAFRVQLSHDLGVVSPGHVIVFDRVDLNLGNAYDARHGIFTAPYNGTYQFGMTLGNPGGQSGDFFLKKNGKGIEMVWAGHNANWEMGGVSTVAELYAGDDVWIEGQGLISGGSGDVLHTGFSGVLINTI